MLCKNAKSEQRVTGLLDSYNEVRLWMFECANALTTHIYLKYALLCFVTTYCLAKNHLSASFSFVVAQLLLRGSRVVV